MTITDEEKEILLSALAHLMIETRARITSDEKEEKIIENLFEKIRKYVEVID